MGVRRYQNKDGSLTPEGEKRYDEKPKSKAQIKRDKKKQTRNSKLILAGTAASVVTGAIIANKLLDGKLSKTVINKLPKDSVDRAIKAAYLTAQGSFVAGVDPFTMAGVLAQNFIWNYTRNT